MLNALYFVENIFTKPFEEMGLPIINALFVLGVCFYNSL